MLTRSWGEIVVAIIEEPLSDCRIQRDAGLVWLPVNWGCDMGRIVAVVNDLFFAVKISAATKQAGVSLEYIKDSARLVATAKDRPALIILDLNDAASEPLRLIAELKANAETAQVPLLGYLSHVQTGLKQKALDAGCDTVMARSAFDRDLPAIVTRYGAKA